MATYVMSDLHGAYSPLIKMLEKIEFGDDDELYILGDVIDRGPDGIQILQLAQKTPNIHMLLGNHEHMMIQYYKDDCTEKNRRQWNRNSNFFTLYGFDKISAAEQKELLAYLENLPSEEKVVVNGTRYTLVHGFLGEDTFHRVWNRPKIDEQVSLENTDKIIIGHTPVCEYVCPGTDEDIYVYSKQLTDNNDHFKIFYAKSFIDVDCCIGYGFSAARLACLRLDDGKEFYEKVEI